MPASDRLLRLPARRFAVLAAAGYLVFGIAWVLGSDYVIATLSDDAAVLSRLQSAKGSVFILLSAVAIYVLVRIHGPEERPSVADDASAAERPRLGLQLLLLTGAIMLPLIALLAYNVQREARRDIDSAAESAHELARIIAADTSRIVRDVRQLAEGLALRTDLRALDADRCDPQLAEITRLVTYVANVVTLRRDGSVACSALGLAGPIVDPARLPLFHPTRGESTIVGRLTRGPVGGRWVVPFATPLREEGGQVAGVLVLSIDVSRLTPLTLPPATDASFVTLIDGDGSVLMRVPDPDRIGTSVAQSDIARIALEGRDGRGRARSLQGNDQIFGYARVEGSEWIAIAAVPARTALAASRESAARSAIIGALIVIATLLVAYAAGRRIERPMRAIAGTARSVAEGDLAARAPVAGSRETAEVAAQLNRLLDRLPRIESQLRASERRLSLVLRAAQEGIVVSDEERRIAFANEAAARLLGCDDPADIVGDRLSELLRSAADPSPGSSPPPAQRPLDRPDRYELRIRARDGVERWLLVSETPVRNDTGGVEGGLAMLYDITERKDVEERLARVTRLYWALSKLNEAIVRTADRASLFEDTCRIVVEEGGFVSAVVWWLDGGRRLVPAAGAGARHGVLGMDPISLAEDSPFSRGVVAAAIRNAQPDIVNDLVADDRTLPAREDAKRLGIRSLAAFPLRSEGRVVGALVVYAGDIDYFDIGLTELLRQVADDVSFALDVYERAAARDRAEAEVRELNAELERRVEERTARLSEANRDLESFSYSVSHDLRAPVRAINGFAQLLASRTEGALDDEAARLLQRIVRASTHMGHLIDDLLAFAQLGRDAVDPAPVELAPIIERVIEELRPAIEETRASVTVAPLPAVLGDTTLLHQIFANLIANAIEYRRPDVAPRIAIDARAGGERIEVAIRDNGIGIAPEYHRKIFEMFARLHSTSSHPGTGIGLALAARAAALMQGEIVVDSAEGEGATFRVLLPRPDAPPGGSDAAAPRAENRV